MVSKLGPKWAEFREIMRTVDDLTYCHGLIFGRIKRKSPAPPEGAGHSQGERRSPETAWYLLENSPVRALLALPVSFNASI
jgi:hypothetical protein